MRRIIWFAVMFSLYMVTVCQATSISFQAASDEDAYSSDGWVTVGMDYTVIAPFTPDVPETLLVYNLSPFEVRSALEFDITSLPSNINIDSAVLSLYAEIADNNIGVHAYSGDGVVNVDDFFFFNLGIEIATFDPSPINMVNVTLGVSNLFDSGASFVGFQLLELAQDDPTLFGSNQFFDPSLRPTLDIVFSPVPEPIPEPSTFLLLGGGLIGLAFAVRRRRKE